MDLVSVVPTRTPTSLSAADVAQLYQYADMNFGINEPLGAPCEQCLRHSQKLAGPRPEEGVQWNGGTVWMECDMLKI